MVRKPYKCRLCGGSNYSIKRDGHRRCLTCYPEYRRKWTQNYRDKNKEKLNKKRRDDYAKNRNRELGKAAAYRTNNPYINQEHSKRREQKIRAGKVTRKDLEAIVSRDKGRCIYCGRSVETTCTPSRPRGFDHLVPLLDSTGKHESWNLAVCCIKCNANKSQTHFCDYIVRKEIDGPQFEQLSARAWGLE